MSGFTVKHIMGICIAGTGTAFPGRGKWILNEDIHAMVFGSDWQQKMAAKKMDPAYYEYELGFKKRYWVHMPGTAIAHDELTSADLMIVAAENAISDAKISKDEIDFVIAVTITSPRYATSMGPYIVGKLGINAPAMEMKAGCASNVYAIILASQLIQSGARNVLIACGETNSKILQPNSNMMYAGGDAGAAVIISKVKDTTKGILSGYINSNGTFSGHMGVPGLMPPNQKDLDEQNYFLQYSDTAEEFLNKAWSTIPGILYESAGMNATEIDCLIPHQVLKKKLCLVSDSANVPMKKTINILADYANCGSATILLALDHARKNNLLEENNKAMMVAAGGGITYGGIILKT